jgi:hypothetical protein
MPMVASQKCQLIIRSEYIRWRCHNRGTRKYITAKVIIPFQPSAPECTWPIVQSV